MSNYLITINGRPKKDLFSLEIAIKMAENVITDKAISTNKQIYYLTLQELRKNYDSEGSYFGSKWKKLSGVTLKRKGGNRKILVDRGDLRASVLGESPSNHRRTITRTSVKIESTLSVRGHNLASLHHKGTKYLPKRRLYKENGQYLTKSGLDKIDRKYNSLMGLAKKRMEDV